MRALAYVAGGVGLVGIGLGTFFGVRAISKNKDSKDISVCPPANMICDARDAAFTLATGSTVSFAVGLAGLGAGVGLFIASRPDPAPAAKGSVSVKLVPTVGGAAMMGSF